MTITSHNGVMKLGPSVSRDRMIATPCEKNIVSG